jgi:Zn-dependent peptidase ImmA (M78 family)/transcriptional regulator with XRE-family HTH domain
MNASPPNWTPRLIPERLKEGREAQGWTMTELADRIEVSRQAVSQYELGTKQPTSETMFKIAGELKLPISYFTTERPNGGRSGTVFFRSFMSRKKTDNKRYEIRKRWVGQIANCLGEFVDFPRVDLPSIPEPLGDYQDDEIEAIAAKCRRHWGLGDGPISNIVALLESKGIVVNRSKLVPNVFGFSCWHADQRPFVFLGDAKGSAVRSRFDAAHELAHILLHQGITQEQLEDPVQLKKIEREAHRFAGAFLLPATSFPFEVFHHSLGHFIDLKRRWRTSIAAMIVRCEQLGIFDEDRVLRFRKQMGRFRKIEPLDVGVDAIPFERPTLLAKSLTLLLKHRVRLPAEVVSALRLPGELIADFCGVNREIFDSDEPSSVVVQLRSLGEQTLGSQLDAF